MRILHLEDNGADAELTLATLREEWGDCESEVVATRAAYQPALLRGGHDVILSDFSLVSFDGLEGLYLARQYRPEVPFIFFSGTIREEVAVEAMRDGASDYVLKDRPRRLVMAIRRALQKRREEDERCAAERRLREQNDLLDRARDAIVVTDLDKHVLSWNQGATRLLGWTAAETVGQRLEKFLGPDAFGPAAVAAVDEWRGELAARSKSGYLLVLETHVTLVRDEAQQPRARVSISTDITEKYRLKEQFARAQRMECLGTLAAGIAHDLNNLLAPILVAPALLREQLPATADAKLLDMLEAGAQRGSALVRQILGFARGHAGPAQLLHLEHLCGEMATFAEQTFPHSIRVERSIAGRLWPVFGSPSRLHQVLLNLCINARDAMPRGGTLRLHAENMQLDPPDPHVGRWVVLEVQDSGCGIAPDVQEKIWEPFFSTKPVESGTGLGLSTVRGIVEDHRGFVQLESSVGGGTTFRVHLPAANEADGPLVPDAA